MSASEGDTLPVSKWIAVPDLSYRAIRVWQRNCDTYLRLWKTELWPPFVEPVMYLLAFGVGLGLYVTGIGGQSYIEFIAPGILAQSAMFAACFECTYGSFIRMEHQKTFDAIIATPVSIEDVVAGEILWGASRGLLSSFAILVVISVMGLVEWPAAILTLPFAALAAFMFASISMLITAVVPSISSFNYFFTLALTPMFLVSGVFFPLDGLPPVFQQLAWLSPLTHVVIPVRAAASGHLYWGLLWNLAFVGILGAVAFYISLGRMSRRLVK